MAGKDPNKKLLELFAQGSRKTDKIVAGYEKTLVEQYKTALKEIRSLIADIFAKYGDALTYEEMQKYNRFVNLEKAITEELRKLGVAAKSQIRQGIKDVFSTSFYYTGYALESSLQIKLGFGILDPRKIEAAVLNQYTLIQWPERLKGHINALNNRVREAVAQGLIQGIGLQKTAASVQDRIERDAYQALRIIRTESNRAQSAGRLAGFEESEAIAEKEGFKVSRLWISTLDDRTRDSHIYLDGETADDEGLFHFRDGGTTEGPGLSGIAAEDIHCRCSLGMRIDELPPQTRRSREDDLIPYATFEAWQKNRVAA